MPTPELIYARQWDGTSADALVICEELKAIGITAFYRQKYTVGHTKNESRSIFNDEPVIVITSTNGPVLAHAGQVISIPKKETT